MGQNPADRSVARPLRAVVPGTGLRQRHLPAPAMLSLLLTFMAAQID
jgi:hypothetical protein